MLGPNDGLRYYLPLRLFAARILMQGHLPLWNPFEFGGMPLLAEPQVGVFHPGVWLFCLLPPVAAMNLQMLATYAAAILGTYVYARALGCTPAAASFAGLTYGFSGFMIAHMGPSAIPQGAACLPWLVWSLEKLRTTLRLRFAAVGIAAVSLSITAGHPPTALYSLMVGGLYASFFAVVERPRVGRWRYLLACAATVAAGVSLTAVQLLPTAELAAHSVRAAMTFDEFAAYSLPVRQLPMLLFPFLFGGNPPQPYQGAWFLEELTGYAGVLPLILGPASVALIGRDLHARFWLGLAAFAFLLVLGPATPLCALMYHVPLYNLFRAQARNFMAFDFALAVLAALSLTALPRRALALSAGGVLGAVLLIAGLAVTQGGSTEGRLGIAFIGGATDRGLMVAPALSSSVIWVPIALVFSAVASIILFRRHKPGARRSALLAIHCVDLFLFVAVWARYDPRAATVLSPSADVRALQEIGASPSDGRVAVIASTATDLRPILSGVSLVSGYDPLLLSRYRDLTGVAFWGNLPADLESHAAILDILNARYLVLHRPSPKDAPPAWSDSTRWVRRLSRGNLTVLENRLAQPRAWLVGQTVRLPSNQVVHTISDGKFSDGRAFDPSEVALIEEGAGREYGPPDRSAEVDVLITEPNAVELRTRSATPAFLVYSAAYYPGWKAYVDGTEAPLVRANYVLRGLEVGAGTHRVRMVYDPWSLELGAALSALTAAVLLGLAVRRGRA